MKKSFTISIPKPCHEDWAAMTPTQKGKFCGVCTKEVFDFSKASDAELAQKLVAGKNLCGRFNNSQVGRVVKVERKAKANLLPYAASLLVPLTLLSPQTSIAESNEPITDKNFISVGIGSYQDNKSIVKITGFITNSHGIPVNKAKVIVKETGKVIYSKPDGSYSIVCTSGSTLLYQVDNLMDYETTINTKDAEINVSLEDFPTRLMTLGRFVAVPITPVIEETIEGEIEIEEILEVKLQLKGKVKIEK